MHRLLAIPALLIVTAAASAWWLLFGAGADPAATPLAGRVLLSALMGGAAVAVSLSVVPVLAPFVAVVSDSVGGRWGTYGTLRARAPRAVGFLVGFAIAFVVTISGTPPAVASLVYKSGPIVHPAGGAVLLLYGLAAMIQTALAREGAWGRRRWPPWIGPATAALFGLVTGLVLAHELDPVYDSVFFVTGNAVAASHAPLTVGMFTLGQGLVVLSARTLVVILAGRVTHGGRILGGLRIAGGIATAFGGAAFIRGELSMIRALLLR